MAFRRAMDGTASRCGASEASPDTAQQLKWIFNESAAQSLRYPEAKSPRKRLPFSALFLLDAIAVQTRSDTSPTAAIR